MILETARAGISLYKRRPADAGEIRMPGVEQSARENEGGAGEVRQDRSGRFEEHQTRHKKITKISIFQSAPGANAYLYLGKTNQKKGGEGKNGKNLFQDLS